MVTKNEEKKRKLKRKIVDVTIKDIRKTSYDKVTMEGIAKSCEITKRTLYKYYPVKEAIISEFIRITFEEKSDNRIEKLNEINDLRSKIHYYMKDLIEGVMREPIIFEKYIIYVMKNLVSYEQEKQQSSGVAEPISIIIESCYLDGYIDASLPKELVLDFFIFSFVELTKLYFKDPKNFNIEKMSSICTDLFMKGIKRK